MVGIDKSAADFVLKILMTCGKKEIEDRMAPIIPMVISKFMLYRLSVRYGIKIEGIYRNKKAFTLL